MDPIRVDSWPLGVNNIAKPNRLPAGAVRDLVNFDPSADGLPALRPGYALVLECSAARAAFAAGKYVIVVDGATLLSYDTETDQASVLGSVADEANVAAAEINGQLYISTLTDSLRTDGVELKRWGISAPGYQVEVIPGGTLSGRYNVAVTAVGDDGEESGADPLLVVVPDNSTLRLTSDDPRTLRMYASVANGETLFYQGLLYGGGAALTSVSDSAEYLTTAGMAPMPACDELVAHNAVLVGRQDRYVFFTAPAYPHLTDSVRGFFQFPAPVRLLAATDGGVYIVADKTYFLTSLETDTPTQKTVLDLDCVEGTAVQLPDGRVAWFTRYGQAIGSPTGEVELVNRQAFAPQVAQKGAAGWVGHNGNEMVVTTMRGTTGANNLATGDFADLEIG